MTRREQIENDFTYHPPRPGQPERYVLIRDTAKEMAILIDAECPDGREKSLAITKLEEAVFWANAAIARANPSSRAEQSMPVMRAKMRLLSVEPHPATGDAHQEKLSLVAVPAKTYPPGGLDEDNSFAMYTPSAVLNITITNPALIGKFRAGQVLYVDFSEVPPEGA